MDDLLGYAASCAVLATFLMRSMVSLRLTAILSNLLFAAFGYIQHIYPVLFLHAVLLPINLWRLFDGQMHSGHPRLRMLKHGWSRLRF
jgi:CRP/FNR family transcriptional regulator, cyclic AMP receptor protein